MNGSGRQSNEVWQIMSRREALLGGVSEPGCEGRLSTTHDRGSVRHTRTRAGSTDDLQEKRGQRGMP
jgi:hypothetical protein